MSVEQPAATSTLIEVYQLPVGPIGTNCYIAHDALSDRCIVVDPGAEATAISDRVDELGLQVSDILVTHCHWDHIGGVADLAAMTGAPVWMGELESPVLEEPERFAIPGLPEVDPWRVDHKLQGTERIEVAGIVLDVLLVPGHSPGHLAFVAPGTPDSAGDGFEQPPICFIGDVIFQGSIGRTDLPFADPDVMRDTLTRLRTRLDPATVLHSGHGPSTTMGNEIKSNPFLRA